MKAGPRFLCAALAAFIGLTASAQADVGDDGSSRGPDDGQPVERTSPVEKAGLSQAGKSLIFRIRTDREISLRKLERQPDLDRPAASYLCFEVTRAGSKIISRICVGGRKNSHHRVGITRANGTGKVYSKDTIPASVKRSGDRGLVFKIDPAEARLKPARYSWRVVDADGTCGPDFDCRTEFPARRAAKYRLRPVEIVGCTGGDGEFVTHGPRGRKRIALTFDDGPSLYTDDVLRILKRYDVKSTFFQIGQEVERYPDESRRILARGHELANHSTHHSALPGTSDIHRTNSIIKRATGFRPCLFRPPGGAVSSSVLSAARANKVKVVNWDIDTTNWRLPGSGLILNSITGARSGSIVLMHDGGGPRSQTIGALGAGIEDLQNRGYELVTVTELLGNEFIYRPK
ncbi:MAG TPA: polysaccharide deacetylase family protein [Solirubrobacterales bacterium]|nr:polysaccharide deacetylase family protein [Solirubrobacterales bacterium]